MEHVFNPYLPLTEYIPDGEPHLFDGRVYIYGSHDRAQGQAYCENHYTVWSAPADNLRDWRCEGVSYRRDQDPSNADDTMQLWAPDVTRGPDGRYYLYYCFSFYPEIGVAVSETPAGPFSFYGHVHYPPHILGGKTVQENMVFDPAVLTDDDGRVFLYYGFAPACEKEFHFPELTDEELAAMPPEARERIEKMRALPTGEDAMVMELEHDMLTAKELPRVLIPGGHHTAGTGFEGHGFFEASSIRKFNGRYYFVYSSHKSHELCWAVSDRPDGDFVYGGILVSNGDVGLNGRKQPVYPLGNNHGGIVQVGEDYYVFYHRQTNGTEFSRQGCAEKLRMDEQGRFSQVEITSCGLNGGPLPASGSYPASVCCHLTDPTVGPVINYNDPAMKTQIRVTETQNTSYITAIGDGAVIGYKYFSFTAADMLALELRGDFSGTITVAGDLEGRALFGAAETRISSADWTMLPIPLEDLHDTHALYMLVNGQGKLDMKSLTFFNL